MIESANQDKVKRILYIYSRLIDGEIVNRKTEADRFSVNVRSIQRDIDDIRAYLDEITANTGEQLDIIYSRKDKGYHLQQIYQQKLTSGEILAICKILLDSRAFPKKDMNQMLHKLIEAAVPQKDRKQVWELIRNEEFHYIELHHKSNIINNLWTIGTAIRRNTYIKVEYQRLKDKKIVRRKLRPAALMFSEFYFYLAAFIDDTETRRNFDEQEDPFPTIYRLDRIKTISVTKEKYSLPYHSKFEEGEFRKRIQFMYGGKLQRIRFIYSGPDIDSVLDRLPTAKIVSSNAGVYEITAEVFGTGIDMWLKSQGDYVRKI